MVPVDQARRLHDVHNRKPHREALRVRYCGGRLQLRLDLRAIPAPLPRGPTPLSPHARAHTHTPRTQHPSTTHTHTHTRGPPAHAAPPRAAPTGAENSTSTAAFSFMNASHVSSLRSTTPPSAVTGGVTTALPSPSARTDATAHTAATNTAPAMRIALLPTLLACRRTHARDQLPVSVAGAVVGACNGAVRAA